MIPDSFIALVKSQWQVERRRASGRAGTKAISRSGLLCSFMPVFVWLSARHWTCVCVCECVHSCVCVPADVHICLHLRVNVCVYAVK